MNTACLCVQFFFLGWTLFMLCQMLIDHRRDRLRRERELDEIIKGSKP